MNETEKLAFFAKETDKLNVLIKTALELFYENHNDIHVGRAIPYSIREFTESYLSNLGNLIK